MMFTPGIDFGTNSVGALIVRCADGAEFGDAAVNQPSSPQGVLLTPVDHRLARQHPGDYLTGTESAEAAMTGVKKRRFAPDEARREVYDELYGLYRVLRDSFGGLSHSADLSQVMKRLIEIKYAQQTLSA